MDDVCLMFFCEYLWIVEGLLLCWVVMENVIGIILVGNGVVLYVIIEGFMKLGYWIEW